MKTQNLKHYKNQHKQSSNDDKNPDPKAVERRAYQIYMECGSDPGHDFEDWLEAERELKELDQAAPLKVAV